MPGIDIEDVEPRPFRPHRRLGMPADQVADVARIHDPRPGRRHEAAHASPSRARPRATAPAGASCGSSPPRRRATTPPPPARRARCTASVISAWARTSASSHSVAKGNGLSSDDGMDRTGPGADHAPAALGLHPAEGRPDMRRGIGHAAGMRHLKEPVGRHLRPDPHRFEQDVVAGIAGHRHFLVEHPYSKIASDPPSSLVADTPRTPPQERFASRPDLVA